MTRPVYSHVDDGAVQPGGASPLDKGARAHFVPQGDDITGELEKILKRLTLDIPDADIDILKQFGFGSILSCFLFEWVPQMKPHVVFQSLRARDLVC